MYKQVREPVLYQNKVSIGINNAFTKSTTNILANATSAEMCAGIDLTPILLPNQIYLQIYPFANSLELHIAPATLLPQLRCYIAPWKQKGGTDFYQQKIG